MPIFLFPGLSGQIDELAAIGANDINCGNLIPICYPRWEKIRAGAIGLPQFIEHAQAQIERHAPSGPICLVGYSFGGHVAFLTAVMLNMAGRAVVRLGLLDTLAFPDLRVPQRTVQTVMRSIVRMAQIHTVAFKIALEGAKLLIRFDQRWLWSAATLILRITSRVWPAQPIDAAFQLSFQEIILREIVEWLNWSPGQFDFPTTLFRCVEQQPEANDDLGWNRFLQHLQVVPIPGSHCTWMNEPRVVVHVLRNWLTEMT